MTRRTRTAALFPAAVVAAAVLLTGCGGSGHSAAPASAPTSAASSGSTAGSTSPAPSASDLAHMQKLVNDADSAAAAEESDAAGDK